MGMADRIRDQRLKMGLTQEELAAKLGLQKSAIAKYENGRVENIKRSVISKMAEILKCSPIYLMGWDSDGEIELNDTKETLYCKLEVAFSDFEIDHFKMFDSLNYSNQQKVISYTMNILNIQKMEEEQDHLLPIAAHERTDIEITDEMRKHDDDIMNDPNF